MAKSADAFRTISEVAEWLDVPAHVLRFWESKFSHIKPVKRAGGRRYYRPDDMRLLGGIKKLLHEDGMTIKGVQKMLRDHGVQHVAGLSRAPEDDPASTELNEPRGTAARFANDVPAQPTPNVVEFLPAPGQTGPQDAPPPDAATDANAMEEAAMAGARSQADPAPDDPAPPPTDAPPQDPGAPGLARARGDEPADADETDTDTDTADRDPFLPGFTRHIVASEPADTETPSSQASGSVPLPRAAPEEPQAGPGTPTPPPPGAKDTAPEDVAPASAPSARRPANPHLPPDPDDSTPAPAGVLSRLAARDHALTPQAADRLTALCARLDGLARHAAKTARDPG